MKAQNIIDYLISISVFLTTLFIVFFFSFSLIMDFYNRISSNLATLRALVISQQLIYFNGSSNISEVVGLNIGRYNELNYTKVQDFMRFCNLNKSKANEFFLSKDFYLKIGDQECFSSVVGNRIKRIAIINNRIETLEIGIAI